MTHIRTMAAYILPYCAQLFCHEMYQPRPDSTPIISATSSAVQAELMPCVSPWKMFGMTNGIAMRNTSCEPLAPSVRAASKKDLSMLLMPVCVAIVTENQTPSAMMKTLPLKSVEA